MIKAPKVAGVVLAAGQSSRMGNDNKLMMGWKGQPMVAVVTSSALKSHLDTVFVVTGHEADHINTVIPATAKALHNPNYRTGMASSLKAGLEECGSFDGVLILLGDMPLVKPEHIDSMLKVFSSGGIGSIVLAANGNQPGNPVLFSSVYFDEFNQIEGDAGAKSIVQSHKDQIRLVDIGEAALWDFDTPEAFES